MTLTIDSIILAVPVLIVQQAGRAQLNRRGFQCSLSTWHFSNGESAKRLRKAFFQFSTMVSTSWGQRSNSWKRSLRNIVASDMPFHAPQDRCSPACPDGLRDRTGDAVFTSPFTFIATAEVIQLLGATPVFVDIDPATFNIDPNLFAAAIEASKMVDRRAIRFRKTARGR